jgi:UDP-N-acetylmuramyl pentapeptide phosphotransferase/UDP-N-acetylglucosamine-1-phosphate transferase
MESEGKLNSIERTQLIIWAFLMAGSIPFWDWRITLGVFVGGLISILNFKALHMIFARGFARSKKSGALIAQYAIKFLALIAVVAGIIVLLRGAVNLIAFLVGLLTGFLAIVVAGIRGYQYTGQAETNHGA